MVIVDIPEQFTLVELIKGGLYFLSAKFFKVLTLFQLIDKIRKN
jgi:hypothetical protein